VREYHKHEMQLRLALYVHQPKLFLELFGRDCMEIKDEFMFELDMDGDLVAYWESNSPKVRLRTFYPHRTVEEFEFDHIPTRGEVQAEILRRNWTSEILEIWQRVVDVESKEV
jgi:hypothetical protein